MLERATGCLENAGRRVLRKSNNAVQSRKSLPQSFWKDNGSRAEPPQWFLALLQASGQRPSPSLYTRPDDKEGGSIGSSGPLLDFLCPREPRRLVAPRPHAQKRPGLRRRRTLVGFSRPYVSVSSLQQAVSEEPSSHEHAQKGGEEPQDRGSIDREREKQADLHALLEKDSGQFDIAWLRFVALGRPPSLNSALCAYLSKSKEFQHRQRAWELFQGIPPESRTRFDYNHVVTSQLGLAAISKPRHLRSICHQVVSTPFAQENLSLVANHFVDNREWRSLRSLYELLLSLPPHESEPLLDSVLHRVTRENFPEYSLARHLLDLVEYTTQAGDDTITKCFAKRLVERFANSPGLVKLTPSSLLLELLRKHSSLGTLGEDSYIKVINAHLHGKRDQFIRSILLYRQFRLDWPCTKPPKGIQNIFIERLLEFDIPESMDYFLDEIATFRPEGPSIKVYVQAMTTFARASEARNVHRIYDRLVAEHGKPKSRRIIAPLLLVHAKLGDVPETLRHFQQIVADFDSGAPIYCWNMLLLAYVTAGDLPGALSTYSQLVESGGEPPNSHTFGTLLPVFSKRGDVQNVRRLINEAQDREVKITTPMIDAAVKVYCNNKQTVYAEELVEAAWKLADGSPVPLWNTILVYHARRLSKNSFRRVLRRMGEVGLTPDAMTHAAIMLAFSLSNQPDFARKALRKMDRIGLQATQYHYAILLLGYLRCRNRDMIHVVFREIEARFGKIGLNSNIAYLKMQIKRDSERKPGGEEPTRETIYQHAENTLMRLIQQFDDNPSPVTHGTPLTVSGSAVDATAQHYQPLLQAYAVEGAIDNVVELVNQYLHRRQIPGTLKDNLETLPMGFVKSIMTAYQRSQQFEKVEICWKALLVQAGKYACTVDLDEIFSDSTSTPVPSAQVAFVTENESTVLPANRFILDKSFGNYMRSLACLEKFSKIHQEVVNYQKAGFALSGQNWAIYVASLVSSNSPKNIMDGFLLFESKFAPNFPGWSWMKQGYGFRPRNCPVTILHLDAKYGASFPNRMIGPRARKEWTRISPGYMHPNYPTMVILAATMKHLRGESIREGSSLLNELRDAAPNTYAIISSMPYLRDKYQGALLREREPFANKLPSPINILTTRTGALGINGKPKFRDRSKAEEPFDLEFLTTPNPIDEKNVTQLLPDEERDKLGSLASVLPRADRMNLEQQFHEYTKVTNFQSKRQLRIQKIIGRAHGRKKNKGLVHGIPVRAFVNKYLLKRNTVESIFFDRYNCRWKSRPDNSHQLFRSVTGLRERHRPEIYSARGTLKRRGIGRMRMKRRDEPTKTPEEWAAKAQSRKDKAKHLQGKIPQEADEPVEIRL